MSGVVAACLMGASRWTLTLDISNSVNPNIPSLLTAAGWAGNAQAVRIVNTALVNTLSIPASLDGADITLINQSGARIGGVCYSGKALTVRAHIKIDNLGILSGGGGGGARGDSWWISRTLSNGTKQSASGFGGYGGRGQGFDTGSLTILPATAGDLGGSQSLAPTGDFGGGGGGGRSAAAAYGGDGGTGGGWGIAGGNSISTGGVSGDYDTYGGSAGGSAGAAGKYIDGNSFVTWINTGTRLGDAS